MSQTFVRCGLRLEFRIPFACSGNLLCMVVMCGTVSRGPDKNPFAGNANAATVGESQFRANCAFCHGLVARGGGRDELDVADL
jgi:hypothetical protein